MTDIPSTAPDFQPPAEVTGERAGISGLGSMGVGEVVEDPRGLWKPGVGANLAEQMRTGRQDDGRDVDRANAYASKLVEIPTGGDEDLLTATMGRQRQVLLRQGVGASLNTPVTPTAPTEKATGTDLRPSLAVPLRVR